LQESVVNNCVDELTLSVVLVFSVTELEAVAMVSCRVPICNKRIPYIVLVFKTFLNSTVI